MNQELILKFLRNKFQNRKILILGVSREGQSTLNFLKKYLPDLKLSIADKEEKKLENYSHINCIFGKNYLDNLDSFDIILRSAGVSPYIKQLENARNNGVEFSSNTQLFFELAKEIKSRSRIESGMTIIGVTGTKGKSTTTALIHHVLKENGFTTYLGGNIGIPPLDLITKYQNLFFVLELSSHQLDNLDYSPDIAVIQAILPEHLDYYANFDEYVKAKANITKYQNENDLLIYFETNEVVRKIAEKSKAKKIPFSTNNFISLDETKLKGKHNLINMMPSIIIGQKFGLNDNQIKQALKNFKGLPHRLEFVANINGVEYYNDSLATNPYATIAALETFKNKPIILIAGGFDRGLDYAILAEKIANSNVKKLILFPDTGEKILQSLEEKRLEKKNSSLVTQLLSGSVTAQNMFEAVSQASKFAATGDVVLMSPASASFNMFKDYADRGNQFKTAVEKLKS